MERCACVDSQKDFHDPFCVKCGKPVGVMESMLPVRLPRHPIFDREQANHNASGWIIPGLPRNPAPTGQPCPTVNHFPDGKINLSDHSSVKTAVQKDRLRQMFEQVLERIPDNQFIVGFDLKILFDHENKPYLRHIAFGQLCDEQPTYPNLDMIRQFPNGGFY